ncbi:MAG TPA: translation elongation factor Ts [Clostridia bacterium]|nr:translation elongation factor Ts [Clostridia bacterium]
MSFDASTVKELRERTGAGIMDCKKALMETQGNMEKAVEYLRQKGLAAAAKKAQRVAREGVVDAYIHAGGRIGVLVELDCETDFVARTDEFKNLAHELAMQVAALNPSYVSRDDVPQSVIEKEREILRAQAKEEGRPEKVLEKIVEGRLAKFYETACLLEQPYIRNQDVKVKDLINEVIAKVGENIVVRRFVRFEVGEEKEAGEAQV